MRRKSVGWHYCTESRLDLPIVWWEVSPSFLCTPEFGPSGGRRGKRNKGYPVLGCVVSHEDLEDFLEKGCTFMCQAASRISPPPTPASYLSVVPSHTVPALGQQGDGASLLRSGPKRDCSSTLSVSFSLSWLALGESIMGAALERDAHGEGLNLLPIVTWIILEMNCTPPQTSLQMRP